jgi:hypothetical protein
MKRWVMTLSTCAALALPMGSAAYAHDGDAALGGLVGSIVGGLIGSGAAPVYVAPPPERVVIERYEPAPVVIERYSAPPVYYYRHGDWRWHHRDWDEHRWHRHHHEWDDD